MSTVATLTYGTTPYTFDHNEIVKVESFQMERQVRKELQNDTPVKYIMGTEWYNFIVHFRLHAGTVYDAIWALKDIENFITFVTYYKNGTQNFSKHVKINPNIIFPFIRGLLKKDAIVKVNFIEAISDELASDIMHDQYAGV